MIIQKQSDPNTYLIFGGKNLTTRRKNNDGDCYMSEMKFEFEQKEKELKSFPEPTTVRILDIKTKIIFNNMYCQTLTKFNRR